MPTDSFAQAKLTDLKEHNAVKVTMQFAFVQEAGQMKAQVHVGGRLIWEQTAESSGATCTGQTSTVEAFIIGHTDSQLAVDVSGILQIGTYFESDAKAKFT